MPLFPLFVGKGEVGCEGFTREGFGLKQFDTIAEKVSLLVIDSDLHAAHVIYARLVIGYLMNCSGGIAFCCKPLSVLSLMLFVSIGDLFSSRRCSLLDKVAIEVKYRCNIV